MSIQLHHKHGLNPMLTNCYYCGEASGVALLGVPKKAVKEALAAAGAPVDPSGAATTGVTNSGVSRAGRVRTI